MANTERKAGNIDSGILNHVLQRNLDHFARAKDYGLHLEGDGRTR